MERLGYGRGGIREIQKHTWFESFNWDGLRNKSLKAPIVPNVSMYAFAGLLAFIVDAICRLSAGREASGACLGA